jgi:CDP-diacylglycerol--glycerol-3-phosphate 3-phosphatidyltransferase
LETQKNVSSNQLQVHRKDILTAGNLLSLFRVLILPFVIIVHQNNDLRPDLLLVLLTVSIVFSDFLDGYLSRKLNQVTELGKWLDPITDKICAFVLFTYVWWIGWVPLWFYLLVILRDLFILTGSFFIKQKRGKVAMSVMTGKVAVFIMSLYWISLVFFPDHESSTMILKYASTVMLIISGGVYFVRGYRILKVGVEFK